MEAMLPILETRQVYKRFAPGPWAIADVNLAVAPGSLVYVLGPSGCGKTTLLRLVCGFHAPDAGEIIKEGLVISRPGQVVPPEQRRIGMVFQDYALFPHLTVADNVRFGLDGYRWGLGCMRLGRLRRSRQKIPPADNSTPHSTLPDTTHSNADNTAESRTRLADLYDLTGLTGLEARYPHELSGGQQQRVALARALARRPHLILLDEPFSNLDTSLRVRIRDEMRSVLRRSGATSLLVTHDQEEAINLADKIAVMNQGRLMQVGTPEEIINRPVNRFVASFVGRSEFIEGTVEGNTVVTELGRHPLPRDLLAISGTRLEVQLRPSYFEYATEGSSRHSTTRDNTESSRPASVVEARVVGWEYEAGRTLYQLALPSGIRFHASLPPQLTFARGDNVPVRFVPPELVAFPVRPARDEYQAGRD